MTAPQIFLVSLLINASMCVSVRVCFLSACHTVCLFLSSVVSVRLPHLLLQYAVKDEDEHALQRVEDGEKVGHDDGALVDVHQAESPGQAQQTQQGYGPNHPRPAEEGE